MMQVRIRPRCLHQGRQRRNVLACEAKAVALDDGLPGVHRRRDMDRRCGRQPLRHRQHDHAAIGFRQKSAFGNGAAGQQRRIEIQPTEQPAFGDMQGRCFSGPDSESAARSIASQRIPHRARA